MKYLDLSMNGLSNEGARLIGEALAANENLQELNISGNRIGIEGASHIARALQTNNTLNTLRVSNFGTSSAPGDQCLRVVASACALTDWRR